MNKNLIDEVNYQKRMLSNLQRWLRNGMIVSSIAVAFIVFGSSYHVMLAIMAGVVLAVSVIANILIGLAIKNGRENVNKIIESI